MNIIGEFTSFFIKNTSGGPYVGQPRLQHIKLTGVIKPKEKTKI